MTKSILVTGSAGFIGFHVAKALLDRGDFVIGIDNFNNYYDPSLKEARNKILEQSANYKLYRTDICDQDELKQIFSENKVDIVVHLAAQAGVRYSLEYPQEYVRTNIEGSVNIFEAAHQNDIKHIVYASSSSVYGNNPIPWSESQDTNRPINPYGATKQALERLAYAYHHLYGLNMTGLRFFTVYGPYGRPDMAYFKFTDKIARGEEIEVCTHPRAIIKRDFTYIDDIVSGVLAAIDRSRHDTYNLGNNKSEDLNKLITLIEKELNKKAKKKSVPLPPGEFLENIADITRAKQDLGFAPKTSLSEGINKFIAWYKNFYAT